MDDSIYDNWDRYEQGRLSIGQFNAIEHIWVRILPDGNYGIDNEPLWSRYRYQDIVEPKNGSPQIIHRRWKSKIWFWYKADKDDLPQRRTIHARLSPHGDTNFFIPGLGFILLKEESDEGLHIVEAALSNLAYIDNITIGGDVQKN